MPKEDSSSWSDKPITYYEQNEMLKEALVMFVTTQFLPFHSKDKVSLVAQDNGKTYIIVPAEDKNGKTSDTVVSVSYDTQYISYDANEKRYIF